MIAYVAGWTRKKDEIFQAVAQALGGGRRLAFIGLSVRGFPESRERARKALAAAKKQPRGRVGRALKYCLILCQYNWSRRYFMRHRDQIATCWNGITGSRRAFMEGARDAGAQRLYVELAPFPGRVTLDSHGVNALNSVPRTPEFFFDWAAGDASCQGGNWRRMAEGLSARQSRRADVAQMDAAALENAGNFLFCPLQVPNDSQITLFSGWVGSVPGLVNALADASSALPSGWHIRIKEHPSAKAGLGDVLAAAVARSGGRLVIDNQTDTFAQVAGSQGVITINSSVGLQAFFYDRPVIVLGEAFFAIPGLVELARSPDELRTLLSDPSALRFSPELRNAFMNYLDRVYYPVIERGDDGKIRLDKAAVRAKLAC